MNWKKLIALLLFPIVCLWLEIQVPLVGAAEFATHMAEAGEHCDDHCPHPALFLEKPQEANFAVIPSEAGLLQPQLLEMPAPSRHGRDRPPPLFFSLNRSLRAPPTLIPA